jgi:sugar/nucleoside kinase (ribokinase family)
VSKIRYDLYDAIIIADYCKGFLLEEDISFVTKSHDRVFLDTKKILGEWCKDSFIIKINNDEFEKTQHSLSKKIKEKLICTKGPSGCLFRGNMFPVKEVKIKDVSGAGDTFLSALVVSYMKTQDMEKSINFANKCSTQVVQKRGVTPVIMPLKDE